MCNASCPTCFTSLYSSFVFPVFVMCAKESILCEYRLYVIKSRPPADSAAIRRLLTIIASARLNPLSTVNGVVLACPTHVLDSETPLEV